MGLKPLCRWLVIAGTLVIWLIKFAIRPFQHFEEPTQFMLGIAPNLLGSFLIPFSAYWFFSGRFHLLARLFRIESIIELRMVCMMGFCMLVVNEYLQLLPFFGRTFDYFDILSSATGLSISYFVFGRVFSRFQLQSD